MLNPFSKTYDKEKKQRKYNIEIKLNEQNSYESVTTFFI